MQALSDKLDDLPYENEQDSSLSISQVDSHSEIHDLTQGQTSQKSITLFNPVTVASKGRPRTLRMKGGLEKSRKINKCSCCKEKGHNRSTCPKVNN